MFDEHGALVTDVPVFVRRPDQIALFATADGWPTCPALPGDTTSASPRLRDREVALSVFDPCRRSDTVKPPR